MNVEKFYSEIAPTPIQYLTTINNKRLWVKRDDLNDSEIQGNKLRKLHQSLHLAQKNNHPLLSFGGAYSNHIAALAAAGKRFNIETIGIIRGEKLHDNSRHSLTLQQAHANGVQLHFVSRSEYREKHHGQTAQRLLKQNRDCMILPEGGSNNLALIGCQKIVDEILHDKATPLPHRLFVACGTGGTLAGIIQGITHHQLSIIVIGVPVLKGATFLYDDIRSLNSQSDNTSWELLLDEHCGGYAKTTPQLMQFISEFEQSFDIPLEPIYTGKLRPLHKTIIVLSLSCMKCFFK